MDPTRLLIVDDHPVFREGLAGLLAGAEGLQVVDTAGDGDEAVRKAVEHQPDVVLMDLKMPTMSGIEATRRIVDAAPGIRVVVLTMMEDDDSVFAAIRAGAHGYLLKGTEIARIVDTVTFVAAGGSIFSPGVAARAKRFLQAGPATPDPPPERPDPDRRAAFPQLTARELELLDLIADGHDNAEIARILTLSEKTVRNHVSNILTKVQLANRYRLIVDARDAGFGAHHDDRRSLR